MKLSLITSGILLATLLIQSPSVMGIQGKPTISKQQAASVAKGRVKGKVLKVVQGNGYYNVKILTKSGRVVSVRVNASG